MINIRELHSTLVDFFAQPHSKTKEQFEELTENLLSIHFDSKDKFFNLMTRQYNITYQGVNCELYPVAIAFLLHTQGISSDLWYLLSIRTPMQFFLGEVNTGNNSISLHDFLTEHDPTAAEAFFNYVKDNYGCLETVQMIYRDFVDRNFSNAQERALSIFNGEMLSALTYVEDLKHADSAVITRETNRDWNNFHQNLTTHRQQVAALLERFLSDWQIKIQARLENTAANKREREEGDQDDANLPKRQHFA